ncbi:MAG: hypothetical protein KY454_13355, partial [Actinobacteria bacterium]|nr:hypothetical protein [Actinomycetota bacterium]
DDHVVTRDLFLFDFGMGVGDDGLFRGHLKPTGLQPLFARRMADHGTPLDLDLFEPEGPVRPDLVT